MSTTTQPLAEHGVLHYIRIQEKLDHLEQKPSWIDPVDFGAIPMAINTKLSRALDDMSCISFIQFPFDLGSGEGCVLTIGDVPAGDMKHPDVDVILQKSAPSAFGRGEETVLDPSYRSGHEIPAADIGLKADGLMKSLQKSMNTIMFPRRTIELKLYKLAMYQTGGHFDWHMDSTHSDMHHGTLLVALNTAWEGGDLLLRRNGVETRVDLRPQVAPEYPEDKPDLQAVAFFTDTEHRVEPVKDGVRIVLQYDIEIVKQEGNEVEKEKDEESDGTDDEDEDNDEPWMDKIVSDYSSRMEAQAVVEATADKAAVEKVLKIIRELHREGAETVAFALQYLYRQASISAEYLKGSDAVLHDALMASGDFEVYLHPVVHREVSNWDGEMDGHYAYRFDDIEEETFPEPPSGQPPKKKQKKTNSTAFHIPKLSAIQQISAQEYIEHTGNEAMPAEYRYFGGGMFVRPKAK
jgi:hypothetical protein